MKARRRAGRCHTDSELLTQFHEHGNIKMENEDTTIKLQNFIDIKKGEYITRDKENEGIYPVILGGKEPAYYIDRYNHEGKAIVVSRSGASAGYVSLWNEKIFVTDGFLIEPKNNVSYDYIYYFLKSREGVLKLLQGGAAIPHVTPRLLNNLQINLPPLPTQQKIASILSAYDKLIQNYKKQIEALQTSSSELYKEWFVRFRFPGYQTAEFENGIPKGWKVEKLTKLVEVKYGKDHSKLDVGNIPVYGSGGIMRYCNKALYDKETVLIPRKGSLNNIMYANNPLWTVDTMFYTVMLRKNIAKYLYYVLSKIDMESFNAGAALPSMTTEILSHFKIIVPDNEILESFDKKIALIFTQIDNLQQQITNLTQQRDLLLPRLMSGKLEVEK